MFPLHGTSARLGRGTQPDVGLEDDAVSTRHAHVSRRADGLYLQDGGSLNGTFVNDERVESPRRLVDGDHVRVGNTTLKFAMLDELEEHAVTQLFELAIHDSLTHAYSRRHLTAHLRSELALAAGRGQSIGLLSVGIDDFARVNDAYGHRLGDAVLRLVAAVIQRTLRPYDTLYRYAGDEFVVVVRNSSLRNARILGERIRHNVEGTRISGTSMAMTVTVGVTVVKPGCNLAQAEAPLEAIDQARSAARRAGRNQVSIGHPTTRTQSPPVQTPHTLPPRA